MKRSAADTYGGDETGKRQRPRREWVFTLPEWLKSDSIDEEPSLYCCELKLLTEYHSKKELCSRCASIDFETFFSSRFIFDPEVIQIKDLGKLDLEPRQSSCTMCLLFSAVKPRLANSSGHEQHAMYSIRSKTFYYGIIDKSVLAAAQAKRGYVRKDLDVQGESTGFIASASIPGVSPLPNSLHARQVCANYIDFNILRDWIKSCVDNHTRQCDIANSSASYPRPLRLIDFEKRQIIEPPSSCKYAALSYVWGTSNLYDEKQPINGMLSKLLPQTIEDAFRVSKELGLEYIWIDRYCIDQANEAEKLVQIQQMDLVYQNAFVTIITAAGDGPDFGLPGVSQTPRSIHPGASTGQHCLVSTLVNRQELIRNSIWMKRAWTYQESFFSHRRLVFTEQQVYFECRASAAHETVDHFVSYNKLKIFTSADEDDDNPGSIFYTLAQYCGREHSYQSDAIAAFEGVFHYFKRKKDPIYHYIGVPIMPSVIERNDIAPGLSGRNYSEGFIAGLCWRSAGPGLKRATFPTWSWAGWTASLLDYNREFEEGLKLGDESRPKVFVETVEGSLKDFEDYDAFSKTLRYPESLSRFIHVESWVLPLNIQHISKETERLIDAQSNFTDMWANLSKFCASFADDKLHFQVPLYILYRKCENSTSRRVVTHDFSSNETVGMIFGRCEDVSFLNYDEGIFVLIVQKKGNHFERIGHMELTGLMLSSISANLQVDRRTLLKLCFKHKQRRRIRIG